MSPEQFLKYVYTKPGLPGFFIGKWEKAHKSYSLQSISENCFTACLWYQKDSTRNIVIILQDSLYVRPTFAS